MEILENINELGNKLLNNLDTNLKELQENFLSSKVGQIANAAVDVGLKALLPDYIENEVIEVKDALVTGGIKEGINTAVENSIKLGKKALGIEEENFESIEQAAEALKSGDVITGISNGIDVVINKLENSGLISENTSNLLKSGKDLILNNIDINVENEFLNEIKALEKIEKYIDNWEKYYSNKDIEGLSKEYNKIENQMKKILPLENQQSQAHTQPKPVQGPPSGQQTPDAHDSQGLKAKEIRDGSQHDDSSLIPNDPRFQPAGAGGG